MTTSVATPTPEQEFERAVAQHAARIATIAPLRDECRSLAERIEHAVGGAPHPLRPVLAEKRGRLAALLSAAVLEERRVAECHRVASRARAEARADEYSKLITAHLRAALALAASVGQIEQFIAEVTDGGRFEFPLAHRFVLRSIGSFGDRLSTVRLLLREAKEAGFAIPDVARFGFELPGELQPREEVAQ